MGVYGGAILLSPWEGCPCRSHVHMAMMLKTHAQGSPAWSGSSIRETSTADRATTLLCCTPGLEECACYGWAKPPGEAAGQYSVAYCWCFWGTMSMLLG